MACLSPYYSQVKGNWVPFPCGRCPPCKKRRVDSWVFRMMQEDKVSSSSHFVTLTYDTRFVPISPNGFMTLDKTEFPRFMKRLRKLCPGAKIKYYACGEYGSKNLRPHYHAIIFNVPSSDLFFDAWSLDGVNLGSIHVGQVSGDSVAYTMKYIDKSQYKARHGRDDRVPEFALMSKRLGATYLSKAVVNYHKADLSRNYLTKDGGQKIALPRYYRDRIFDEEERDLQRGIIEVSVGKANSENYALYLDKFSHVQGYTYDMFLESQRLAVVNSFYSTQKSRL